MTPERIKELREVKEVGVGAVNMKLLMNECLSEIERLEKVIKDLGFSSREFGK